MSRSATLGDRHQGTRTHGAWRCRPSSMPRGTPLRARQPPPEEHHWPIQPKPRAYIRLRVFGPTPCPTPRAWTPDYRRSTVARRSAAIAWAPQSTPWPPARRRTNKTSRRHTTSRPHARPEDAAKSSAVLPHKATSRHGSDRAPLSGRGTGRSCVAVRGTSVRERAGRSSRLAVSQTTSLLAPPSWQTASHTATGESCHTDPRLRTHEDA